MAAESKAFLEFADSGNASTDDYGQARWLIKQAKGKFHVRVAGSELFVQIAKAEADDLAYRAVKQDGKLILFSDNAGLILIELKEVK